MTDLTGTTWVINATPNYAPFTGIEYSAALNFISNNTNFRVFYPSSPSLGMSGLGNTYYWYADTSETVKVYNSDARTGTASWTDEVYRTVQITGGSDATNSTVIAWFEANAVQQSSSTGYTGTITSSGYNSTVQYVRYPSDSSGTIYYTAGDAISVSEGDSVYFYCNAGPTNTIFLDGTSVGTTSYTWVPDTDFEVEFTASIASWGVCRITRTGTPPTPDKQVVITYDSATVTSITEDGTTTLSTSGKIASTNIVVSGTDVYSTEITYNGNTIATGTGTFTKTLECAGQLMNSNVGITVQIEEPVVPDDNCITFTTSATTASLSTANSLKNWDGTLEYSYDKAHWNTWDGPSAVDFKNGYLHLRGSGNTYLTGSSSSGASRRFVIETNPSFDGSVSCTGNIETLLDWETVKNGGHPTMASYCFSHLFYQCTALGSVPDLLGTSIPSYAYRCMFYGCTGLTTPPALDATLTTSSTYCYYQMFYGCTGLTSVPTLPSSTLAQYCYAYMFYGCTRLTTTPALPATTLASYCYYGMFRGCTSLTTITRPSGQSRDLPATTMQANCYREMFYGCTNLVNAPVFTVSTTASNCCNNMFYGCTKLTNPSITLSATTVTSSCYSYMFYNCKAITATLALPATTLNTNCYEYMYYGCTALTTITIPSGKTVPLPATTLKNYCYRCMFQGCSSLVNAFTLPATTLGTYCYYRMFRGCTKLEQLPSLPATSVSNQAYYQMFYGCSKIMLSTTQTGNYQTAYRIPTSGTGTFGTNSGYQMFTSTGGTFKNTATVNTTYYTSNTVV